MEITAHRKIGVSGISISTVIKASDCAFFVRFFYGSGVRWHFCAPFSLMTVMLTPFVRLTKF